MLGRANGPSEVRVALRQLPIPVVVTRRSDHRVIEANQAMADYLRRPLEEVVGSIVDDWVGVPVEPIYRSGDRHHVFEDQHLRGDGTIATGRVHSFPIPELADEGVFAAAVIDASGQSASVQRGDVLLEVASLLGSTGASDLSAVAEAVESSIFRHFAVVSRIEWADDSGEIPTRRSGDASDPVPVHSVDDLAGDLLAPGRGVEWPISVGGHVLGRLTLGLDDFTEVMSEQFVQVLAAYLGAIHVVATQRSQLRSAAMFEAGFDATRVGMVVMDDDGVIRRANSAFAAMAGSTIDALVGSTWMDLLSPDEVSYHLEAADGQTRYETLARYTHDDGRVIWAEATSVTVDAFAEETGSPQVSIVHLTDITSRMEALEAEQRLRHDLELSERRYRSLVEPSVDLIARLDAKGAIIDLNRTFATAAGLDRESLAGRTIADIVPPRVASAIEARLAGVVESNERSELWRERIELPDRPAGWYVLRFVPEETDPDQPVEYVYLVASEITEVVESEQRLAKLALIDPLTGLSNRTAVFDRLQHALDQLERRHAVGVAVAVIDVDHFKAVNDTYGHAAGDQALERSAAALRSATRSGDTVGRLGGDEFVVVMEDVADRAAAFALGERLRSSVEAITLELPGGHQRRISCSVGVAFTDHRVSGDDLLGRADSAMYQAKAHGRDRTWIEGDGGDPAGVPQSSSAMLRELAAALSRDQFELHYQPIAASDDGRIQGFEALLRWRHPEFGLVLPNVFLGLLMTTGQMGEVGRWVLRTAIRQLAEWSAEPATADLRLHVNASPSELAHASFAELLDRELAHHAVEPQQLWLEVTEQALAGTVVSTSRLGKIAETGVKLVLDDFGTGISSLSHLRMQPLHGIKIDRSFVANAHESSRERAIADSIMYLARSLELDVTAEGVERSDQAVWLAQIGCQSLQGWYVGRPAPAADATAMVVGATSTRS